MNILIIGAGAYGLALSNILSDKNKVTIYSSIKEEIETLKNKNTNEKLFPNITLKNIEYITEIEKKYDLIIIALPTNIIKQVLIKQKEKIKNTKILITSKGIHNGIFPYDIVKETLETEDISVLSGPSFAKDLIQKQTLSLTLAGDKTLKNIFNEEYIKIEETNDIIGTEICGSLKNIYAIGSGILEGLEVSDSTKASYLTKVINDTLIILNKYAKTNTIINSCGVGDIILTCTSKNSRNYTLGIMLGKKQNKNEIEEYIKNTTIEGLNSLNEYKKIIDMDLINILDKIIYKNENPESIIKYIIKT